MKSPVRIRKPAVVLLVFVSFIFLAVVRHQAPHPTYANIFLKRGREFLQNGQPQRAERYFHRAVHMNPRLAESYHALARFYENQNQRAEAFAYYDKAVTVNPDEHRAFNDLGLLYARLGYFDDAIRCFQQASRTPDLKALQRADYHLNLGWGYWMTGRTQQALAQVKRLEDDNSLAWAQRLKSVMNTP